jgi:RNA polymerase sigma factor (sigma-70 family)
MQARELTVYLIDDDPSVRDALGLLLGVRGYRTAVFAGGEDFLKAWQPDWAGCVLIDIRMPGMDGLELQQKLSDLGCHLPVIVITGHGNVESARQAFKARAVDFLEKPLDHNRLISAIDEALKRESSLREDMQRREAAATLLQNLTAREREVMELVVSGSHNREIAQALGISVRTVEVHKSRLMTKLGVDNVADMVRLSMANQPAPEAVNISATTVATASPAV